MKAPDKCYITREKNGVVYSLSFNDNGGLEYIYKDALLKWLEGKMTKDGATEGIVGGYDFALRDVIKHIKSL